MTNTPTTAEDLDAEWCPCGGPPCQTPPGHGCGAMTKWQWLAYWAENKEHCDERFQ
jgi:hypothetical protein